MRVPQNSILKLFVIFINDSIEFLGRTLVYVLFEKIRLQSIQSATISSSFFS